MTELNRYSIITDKNPREILLLRGSGCKWRKCRFCDYHLDYSRDQKANFLLNQEEIKKVTGIYGKLEVINSGSFVDLDKETLNAISDICLEKKISELHFECHWMHRLEIAAFKEYFSSREITVKLKIGVETFDAIFRESYLDKGIDASPAEISSFFDEACLLFGLPGQSVESMQQDIETGLHYFERICINIMVQNSKPVLPDPRVIQIFYDRLYPIYVENPRVDILLDNTDFGVGDQ